MDSVKKTTAALFAALIIAGPVNGAPAVDWSGFVQGHAAARTADVMCPAGTECDLPFNDQRLQLKAEGNNKAGTVGLLAKVDLVHDSALDESDADVREFYVDYNAERLTLRGGRQIITWGVGDLLFINDIFPKDWVAFYSGQPLEYLKRGSDAVKLGLYSGSTTLEVVFSDFRADRLPDSRQFILADPFSKTLPRNIDEPSGQEVAVKLSRQLGRWDAALYTSRSHYRAPALVESATEVRGSYPRLNTFGGSLSGAVGRGVLNLEIGYYDSEDDRDGTDPSIENSQTRFLVGYFRQVGQDTTIGIQAYVEWMHNYGAYKRTLPVGFYQREQARTLATLRFTRRYLHQTLTLNVFAFWGISEDDSYVIPSLRYAFNDNLWLELGANIFGGSRNEMFGAQGDNDNIYLTVRYAF